MNIEREDRVHKLSELTANQIAAGEVVQRPASVVKELLENAIDAGATFVALGIKEGGRALIQVIDDGVGMNFNDALTAFERHATSKIIDSNDLFNLNTFGFRGEALPSIASVAEVELKSMQEGADIGTVVAINGGELIHHRREACSKGTQFNIRNLFFNVPARRKFMKSAEVEARHVIAEFKKVALFYNNISFVLHNNDKCIYNLPNTTLRARVADVMGSKINKELLDIYVDTPNIEVKGYIGRPERARRAPEQYLFINGRYFKSASMHKTIISAYGNLLSSSDITPQYFIYIKCNPSEIDVNIHPSKIEVKFENEESVAQIVRAAVKASLGKNGIMPMIDFDGTTGVEIPVLNNGGGLYTKEDGKTNVVYDINNEEFSFSKALYGDSEMEKDLDEEYIAQEVRRAEMESSTERTHNVTIPSEFIVESAFVDDSVVIESGFSSDDDYQHITSFDEFITSSSFDDEEVVEETIPTPQPILFEAGVELGKSTPLDGRYILTTIGDNIYVVDIRRAMNRIMYDRFRDNIKLKRTQGSHRLLFPVTIPMQPSDMVLIDESLDDLSTMGFSIVVYNDDCSVEIVGVPVDIGDADPFELFEEILDSIKVDDSRGYSQEKRERLIMAVSSVATNKNFSNISTADMQSTVEQLFRSEDYSFSPSGKAIVVKFGIKEIKRILG